MLSRWFVLEGLGKKVGSFVVTNNLLELERLTRSRHTRTKRSSVGSPGPVDSGHSRFPNKTTDPIFSITSSPLPIRISRLDRLFSLSLLLCWNQPSVLPLHQHDSRRRLCSQKVRKREKKREGLPSACHGENGVLVLALPVDDNKGPFRISCGNRNCNHSLVLFLVFLLVGRCGWSCWSESLYACCCTDWFNSGISWTNENKTNKHLRTVCFRCHDNHHQQQKQQQQ